MSELPGYANPEWSDRHNHTVGTYDEQLARVHHTWDRAEAGLHRSSLACVCGPVERSDADYTFYYHEFDPEAVETSD